MKKLVAIVVITIIMILIMVNKKEEKTVLVNTFLEESNILDYKQIFVKIDNLNTNNFKEYFSDMKVLLIYPYINPVYEDKISMVYVYKSIDEFKEYYINRLENLGYYMEANKYLYTPIKINGVIIYSNLEELKYKYSNKVMKECEDSSFYCVKLE